MGFKHRPKTQLPSAVEHHGAAELGRPQVVERLAMQALQRQRGRLKHGQCPGLA